MAKTRSILTYNNYNPDANEGYVIFSTSKLITCFIEGFTLKMKSQLITCVLNRSEHVYWILNLGGEVHSIWDLWINGLQECKGNDFSKVGRAEGQSFQSGPKKLNFPDGRLPLPKSTSPKKFVEGFLTSPIPCHDHGQLSVRRDHPHSVIP